MVDVVDVVAEVAEVVGLTACGAVDCLVCFTEVAAVVAASPPGFEAAVDVVAGAADAAVVVEEAAVLTGCVVTVPTEATALPAACLEEPAGEEDPHAARAMAATTAAIEAQRCFEVACVLIRNGLWFCTFACWVRTAA